MPPNFKSITVKIILLCCISIAACKTTNYPPMESRNKTAAQILGNPNYQAISFGAYRQKTRDIQPTVAELKEDLRLLSAMGIKMLRTYNVKYDEASNLLKAIKELSAEDAKFEMYLMLGIWIDCKNAWTKEPVDHNQESPENAAEVARAVALAQQYPDIIKVLAVGNEAMVKWAAAYYVEPYIILKWVKHLQNLKAEGTLSKDLWITSSDNFASWGGGGSEYHVPELVELIKSVDFISMHTYPMHDTHYNPEFWGVMQGEEALSDSLKIKAAMDRALQYAQNQYESVVRFMKNQGVNKPVHIGETGWATQSNEHYGPEGSKATDEYKSGIYYKTMRAWTNENNITCFYFEAFDEQWKDAANPQGSENHFGLITLKSQAKYAIWDLVDAGVFEGLTRDGKPITKTYDGSLKSLKNDVKLPPQKKEAVLAD
jgi:exo-beta-1,3-glucanase (GH17 family)